MAESLRRIVGWVASITWAECALQAQGEELSSVVLNFVQSGTAIRLLGTNFHALVRWIRTESLARVKRIWTILKAFGA
jgi:hypothetical protein